MKRPGNRIYEGEDAAPGQFPYHVWKNYAIIDVSKDYYCFCTLCHRPTMRMDPTSVVPPLLNL